MQITVIRYTFPCREHPTATRGSHDLPTKQNINKNNKTRQTYITFDLTSGNQNTHLGQHKDLIYSPRPKQTPEEWGVEADQGTVHADLPIR